MSEEKIFDHAELIELIKNDNIDELLEKLDEYPDIEVADLISDIDNDDSIRLLRLLNEDARGNVFSNIPLENQVELSMMMDRHELADLFTHMPTDDRVDLYKEIPSDIQRDLLPYFEKAVRDDILHLSSYPPRTAGAAMSSNFARISKYMTVGQAMQRLKKEAPTRETIYYIYVVDESLKLIGFVSLRDLITTDEHVPVSDIMLTEIAAVNVNDDQEKVVEFIEKYDLLALPVVNAKEQLVGIVTHDDALDILRQEQTEDMEKFMGIAGDHEHFAYINKTSYEHFKGRISWVASLAVLGLISGYIIHSFEDIIDSLIILALYMPMIADTGGNTGSQSATVIVRALALGELKPSKWLFILWKEFRISLMIAFILGLIAIGKVYLLSWGTVLPFDLTLTTIAMIISVSISMQVITSMLVGSSLPLMAKKLKLDPAVVASPMVTTLVDISGLLIYFYTAKMFIGF